MDLFFNSDDKKVVVVTGGNKGIGLAIVKGLCNKFSGDVFLTARNKENGLGAVKNLYKLGLHPKFHYLDVTNYESILKLKRRLEESYGGLDILINNAAIKYPYTSDVPFYTQVKETLAVNYFGLRDVCNVMFPILRSHARVVNLSSSQAAIKNIPGESIREKLSSDDLTEPELSKLMESFVGAVQRGTHKEEGWPDDSYTVSKIAVNALTSIQQREFLLDESREGMVVNAVHPGQIATDLTRFKGYQNATQGAEIPLYAALLPKNIVQPVGSFIWWNKQVIDWINGPIPLI